MAKAAESLSISVVIPTLNEASAIGALLDVLFGETSASDGKFDEVIVVDGGSSDGTVEAARTRGVNVITAERGRGAQMHAGAQATRGDVVLFLHADTLPPFDASALIKRAMHDRMVVGGNFAVCFDGESRAARFLTWLYPQLRRIGLCYGDSGIFVRRQAYEAIGGFQPFPIFEDLDLIRRLRRGGRVVHLTSVVTTSSRRFANRSFALTFARWATMQGLFWIGVHPRTLVRLYAPIRGSSAHRE